MNKQYGLSAKEIEDIIDVFRQDPKVEKAILFGSRAKGNYRPGSDIDIAVQGKLKKFDDFLSLIIKMETVDVLQKIELVDLRKITSKELLDHINRVGIVIYERTPYI